jgi:hypothetical protein
MGCTLRIYETVMIIGYLRDKRDTVRPGGSTSQRLGSRSACANSIADLVFYYRSE